MGVVLRQFRFGINYKMGCISKEFLYFVVKSLR